ncbi:hypothetical protein [Clostridium thailandense]|uniref:hypothetical protein n=1 Tax=Clostridium thailandense TaxID=2794346 RepID=UPI00398909A4
MTNGNVKSYTVPMTKVKDFISWYDNRVSGSTGKAIMCLIKQIAYNLSQRKLNM